MKKKFTLLSVALLAALGLAACSSSSSEPTAKEETASSSSEVVEESSSSEETTTFAVGDTIVFDGVAEITITNVEWTDERNEFDDTNPEKVLKVTYNTTNLSDEDYILGSDITLYVNGAKMEDYPNTNTYDSISSGRSYEGAVQHFGVNGSGAMELEVEPSWSFDYIGDPAIVTLDIQ